MEHCVWAAGELILKLDVPGPDQSNGVGEGGGAALGETADVVTPGGPYRPTYRKKESPCTGTNSGFRNTDYSNVVKILCIRIISGVFFNIFLYQTYQIFQQKYMFCLLKSYNYMECLRTEIW